MIWLANHLVRLIKRLTKTRPYTRELSDHDRAFIEELRKKYWSK